MSKPLLIILGLFLATTSLAQAACPASVPGSTAEAIAANQARILCLQQEITQAAEQRQYELKLQTMDTSIQKLQLDRRFDRLQLPVFGEP